MSKSTAARTAASAHPLVSVIGADAEAGFATASEAGFDAGAAQAPGAWFAGITDVGAPASSGVGGTEPVGSLAAALTLLPTEHDFAADGEPANMVRRASTAKAQQAQTTPGAKRAREALEQQVKDNADRMWTLSVLVFGEKTLSDIERATIARYRKAAGRLWVRNISQLVLLRDEIAAFCARLLAQLTPEQLTDAFTRGAAAHREKVAAPRTALEKKLAKRAAKEADRLPMSIQELPSHTLLADLKAGLITWNFALTMPERTNEITKARERLNAALRADIAKRERVDALMHEEGMTPRAAMRTILGCEPSKVEERWAARIRQRKARVSYANVDRRHEAWAPTRVMVPLVQALVLKWYHGRPGLSGRKITEQVHKELDVWEAFGREAHPDLTLPRPTESSVQHWVSKLPKSIKTVRRGGVQQWKKQQRIVDEPNQRATHPNHIWMSDNTILDLQSVQLAKLPDDGQGELDVVDIVPKLHHTACIDAFAGLVLAHLTSSSAPDALTIGLVLAAALRPHEIAGQTVGGLPEIIRVDHGAEFKSAYFVDIVAALGITLEYTLPHFPDGKPQIERHFRTLNGLLALYPGHKKYCGRSTGAAEKAKARLLTIEQVRQAIHTELEAHATRPRQRGRPSPLMQYLAGWVPQWPDMDLVDRLHLKADKAQLLGREGVAFGNRIYKGDVVTEQGHAYDDFIGRYVTIRFHPEDRDSIYVYDDATGVRLGTFFTKELWEQQGGATVANRIQLAKIADRSVAYRRSVELEDAAAALTARQQSLLVEKERKDAAMALKLANQTAKRHKDQTTRASTVARDVAQRQALVARRRLERVKQALEAITPATPASPVLPSDTASGRPAILSTAAEVGA